MKRILALILTLGMIVVLLFGCMTLQKPPEDTEPTFYTRLTFDDLIALSEKGMDLTWADFEGYAYLEEPDPAPCHRTYWVEDVDVALVIRRESIDEELKNANLILGDVRSDIRYLDVADYFGAGEPIEGDPMTLADLIELSKKGDALTWEDFEKYAHEPARGHGRYQRSYKIGELTLVIYRSKKDGTFYGTALLDGNYYYDIRNTDLEALYGERCCDDAS